MMPYVQLHRRIALQLMQIVAETAGELNYQFTMRALDYLQKHGTSYATINDIIGALEGAKMEFYRRVVAPYEDEKIKENGDVY